MRNSTALTHLMNREKNNSRNAAIDWLTDLKNELETAHGRVTNASQYREIPEVDEAYSYICLAIDKLDEAIDGLFEDRRAV